MGQENIMFMATVPDVGVIAISATAHANLETIKNEYGHNFNTLTVVNNSTEELEIFLDGRSFGFVNSNRGGLSFDWEDGIKFDDIQIKNLNTINDTSANEIRIIVGRTGKANNGN